MRTQFLEVNEDYEEMVIAFCKRYAIKVYDLKNYDDSVIFELLVDDYDYLVSKIEAEFGIGILSSSQKVDIVVKEISKRMINKRRKEPKI
jgi:hypothetical protein